MRYPSQNTGNMRILLHKGCYQKNPVPSLPSSLPLLFSSLFSIPFFFVPFDTLLIVVFSAIQLESPPLDLFCPPIRLSHSFFPSPPFLSLSPNAPTSASDHHTCFPFVAFFFFLRQCSMAQNLDQWGKKQHGRSTVTLKSSSVPRSLDKRTIWTILGLNTGSKRIVVHGCTESYICGYY